MVQCRTAPKAAPAALKNAPTSQKHYCCRPEMRATAFFPSSTACRPSSPGSTRRTEVCTSRALRVARLPAQAGAAAGAVAGGAAGFRRAAQGSVQAHGPGGRLSLLASMPDLKTLHHINLKPQSRHMAASQPAQPGSAGAALTVAGQAGRLIGNLLKGICHEGLHHIHRLPADVQLWVHLAEHLQQAQQAYKAHQVWQAGQAGEQGSWGNLETAGETLAGERCAGGQAKQAGALTRCTYRL